jgi:thymidylate synthase (FAD)
VIRPDYSTEVTATLIDSLASDIDVARAAWVSNYGDAAREKDPKAIEGLIKFLYNNKHMSPFEHGIFKFFIDCPIFVAREFMRHRTFSFNEVSGRYKTLNGKFYVPHPDRPLIQTGKVGAYLFEPGTSEQYVLKRQSDMRAFESAWTEYNYQLNIGIAKETARNVLPVGIYTQFYASVDPRNLMQFLTLRNDKHALYEIRMIAQQMETAFAETMPLTYKAYATAREKERYPLLDTTILDAKNPIQWTEGTPYPMKEPEWAIDRYVPRHRKEVEHLTVGNLVCSHADPTVWNINVTADNNLGKETAKQLADLVKRTDEFGRKKLSQ